MKNYKLLLISVVIFVIVLMASIIIKLPKSKKSLMDKTIEIVLSPVQELHIATLNTKAQVVFRKFIDAVSNETGYTCLITSSFRDFSKQENLDSSIKANVGFSYHNYGFAIDTNWILGAYRLTSKSTKAQWQNSGIPAIAKRFGLRWGGDFTKIDIVHFDYPLFTTANLYALALAQMGYEKASKNGNNVIV